MATRTLTPTAALLDRWRRDTPGCSDRIHLNNAGAALMPRPVLDALLRHLEREAAIGGYEAADEAAARVCETYELVARLVGTAARNIALVENATVGVAQALSALDFRAATGRKFLRGPRGIGFLYASDRTLERGAFPLFVDMRGAEWTDPDAFRLADGARRFENWEFAYALVLALGEATRYALSVGSAGGERAWALAAELRERLAALPSVRVLDRGRERCAIVTIDVRRHDAADLKLRLRAQGVNTSSSDRDDGVRDMEAKGATTVLRLSPHYYNTEDELAAAVQALAELIRP